MLCLIVGAKNSSLKAKEIGSLLDSWEFNSIPRIKELHSLLVSSSNEMSFLLDREEVNSKPSIKELTSLLGGINIMPEPTLLAIETPLKYKFPFYSSILTKHTFWWNSHGIKSSITSLYWDKKQNSKYSNVWDLIGFGWTTTMSIASQNNNHFAILLDKASLESKNLKGSDLLTIIYL